MHPRARLVRILERCQEAIRTAAYWNTYRLAAGAPPLDCEPERIMAAGAWRALVAWDAGDRDTAEAVMEELRAYADRLQRAAP